jgi:ankyrin repeat protein
VPARERQEREERRQERGSTPIVKYLIEKDPKSLKMVSSTNKLPLHVAAAAGRDAVLAELLQHCDKEMLSQCSNGEQTALSQAIRARSLKCVQLLVDAGADVLQKCHSDWTPLHEAASFNADKIIEYLLQKGAKDSLTAKDQLGRTPLDAAVQSKKKKAIAALKKASE